MRMISKKTAQAGTTKVYVKKIANYGDLAGLANLADNNTQVTITDMAGIPQGGDITYTITTPGGVKIANIPAGLLLTAPNPTPKAKPAQDTAQQSKAPSKKA